MNRVPVLAPDGEPLMPTTPSRCRRWLRDGKAKVVHNKLNVFCIQLVAEPSARNTQDVVVGLEERKAFFRCWSSEFKVHPIYGAPNSSLQVSHPKNES